MRPSGHQVTPHLRALFRAGVSYDSSPSRASRAGVSSDSPSRDFRAGAGPIAFARFSVEVYFMHREDALSP